MPPFGHRWTWSRESEVAAAADWLWKHCDGEPIRMADLERASQHVTGERRSGRSLRDALVARGTLIKRNGVGRHADYVLVRLLVAITLAAELLIG